MTFLSDVRRDLRLYCANRFFIGAAVLKLVLGSLFASHYLRDLFIPFVSYFVDSGFSNPWNEFLRRGVLDAFPYSSVMLAALAVPQAIGAALFHGSAHIPWAFQLFLMRLPLLLADTVIYLVLCRWCEHRWKEVLLLYWFSPILLYINYVHGQLDVIPTAFLILSIYYAVRLSPTKAGLLFAMGLASKFHLAAAIPLLGYYLWKKSEEIRQAKLVWMFAGALACGLAVLIAPLLGSEGYRTLVLCAKESHWVYELAWAMPQGMKVLICPLAAFGLVLHFFSYGRMTKDALILYTGLLYTIMIVLVPPMPGWAYWGFPFLCYFLIRHDVVGFAPFWSYNIGYLLYYLVFSPHIAPDSRLHELASRFGNGADLTFTLMNASIVLVSFWVYRVGIKSYVRYKIGHKAKAIGIGGDSASGKHTLAKTLISVLGDAQTVRLHGDDYHRWPREHPAWKEQTHLDPRSNYFRQPIAHILELKSGASIMKSSYDHAKGDFTTPARVSSDRFIVFEGLHPFVFQRMREIFDIRIFIMTEERLRRYWKIRRDTQERGYAREKVVSEMDRREQDSVQFIRPQEQFADWVLEFLVSDDRDPSDFEGRPASEWLKVRHRISSNVVELEELTEELKSYATLRTDWSMEPNLRRQVLEVQGRLGAEEVEAIAYRVFPDLEEALAVRPEWLPDLDGVTQLIFVCLLLGLEKRS